MDVIICVLVTMKVIVCVMVTIYVITFVLVTRIQQLFSEAS